MGRLAACLLALVSLLLPGLGHALAGAARRAIVIALVALVAQLALFLAQQAAQPGALLLLATMALLVLCVLAALWTARDCWRHARAASPGGWRRRLCVAALVAAPTLALALLPAEPIAWRSFYAPSGSMIPTLMVGDRFVVQEGWYGAHAVRRGEVVVFTLPDGAAFVKRVIGLPGDRVQMLAGRLVLNGAAVPVTPSAPLERGGASLPRETWALPQGPAVEVVRMPGTRHGADTPAFQVPPGHVFVMGDNVENSLDSRLDARMRDVPLTALVGRAAIIYWPWTGGRFGKEVR